MLISEYYFCEYTNSISVGEYTGHHNEFIQGLRASRGRERGTSASLTLLRRQHPAYIPIRVRAFRRLVLHRLIEIKEDPSVSALSRVDIMLFSGGVSSSISSLIS